MRTREEVMAEIGALRQRLAELQREAGPDPRTDRAELQTAIEFIGDFDVLQAEGVDLSEGGIGFELRHPLFFEMHFTFDGRARQHRAHLVWMKLTDEGGCRCGFKFDAPAPSPEF
ncbi:MAG: PilZ domain-containing protein [Candidatus Latescibacteria bacterium]|nr:PilZ domain-containing protein [Candidatus Latescibacterota bacterium]